jgi:hypothetical protein
MPCVFLGYCEGTKAYRLMCVETKRIVKSPNVVFLEGTKKVEVFMIIDPFQRKGNMLLWMKL